MYKIVVLIIKWKQGYLRSHSNFNCKLYYLLCFSACETEFAGALLWPTSRRDRMVTQRCSELHPSFRSGVMISRQCGDKGDWSPISIQDCTMFNGSNPLVIVYFTVNTSSTDEATLTSTTDNVSIQTIH